MSKLVIFGTGSFAQVAHFYFSRDSNHEVAAFTVHDKYLKEKELLGLPVVPFETITEVFPPSTFGMFVAVGYKNMNRIRAKVFNQAKVKGYSLASYLSSRCSHWDDTSIGENTFIFEDNTIQPFVTIGNDVVLWSGNHIGHHARIGDHCFLTSHVVVSGHVQVDAYCFIGVNATIRDNIRIGKACLIGAGSLIMRSTKDREVYVGMQTNPDPRSSDEIKI